MNYTIYAKCGRCDRSAAMEVAGPRINGRMLLRCPCCAHEGHYEFTANPQREQELQIQRRQEALEQEAKELPLLLGWQDFHCDCLDLHPPDNDAPYTPSEKDLAGFAFVRRRLEVIGSDR